MDFSTLKDVIIKKRKDIFNGILIFFVISIAYIRFSDTLYESSISLYPAGELSDNNSMLNVLSEYTENFGVNFSSKSNYYIPDIVNSYSLRKKIVENSWYVTEDKDGTNLIKYWELDKPVFISNSLEFFKSFFRNDYYNKDLDNLNIAIDKLDDLISVDEAYSGLIEVNVNFENPKLAADIANYIAEYVIDFVNSEQKKFANKTRLFTEQRFELSKNDLIDSENKLTEFRKIHPLAFDNPELQLERLRLIRDVEVNQEVFITLRNQLEIAKIEESKERLFINVLDYAEPSINKSHPKIILIIFIFIFFGLIINVLFHIVIYNVKRK